MSAMFAGPYREGACQGCGRLNGVEAGGLCLDCRQIKNRVLLSQDNRCRGCGELLDWRNLRVADMCPCNSGRGINHGLVPPKTCTCVECDPQQTGSTRYGEVVVNDVPSQQLLRPLAGETTEPKGDE